MQVSCFLRLAMVFTLGGGNVGIEVPSRTSSPSLRVALSSISGNRGRNGNMADMASAPDLLSRASRTPPPGLDLPHKNTSPGHAQIGFPSGGPRALSPPELSSADRFLAAALMLTGSQ